MIVLVRFYTKLVQYDVTVYTTKFMALSSNKGRLLNHPKSTVCRMP